MNTNDLPITQKLAALMEAGRACNPGMKHVVGDWGNGKTRGCAMTFALAGAGLPVTKESDVKLAEYLGASVEDLAHIARRVIRMNDAGASSLDEIIAAVREDRLPDSFKYEGPSFYDKHGTFAALVEQVQAKMYASQGSLIKHYYLVSVDESAKWTTSVIGGGEIKPAKIQSAKALKVRKGQGWSAPVARHAYA
jgi:hypothetical protein